MVTRCFDLTYGLDRLFLRREPREYLQTRKWALLIAFHSRVFLPYCLAITANQSEEQP